MQPLYERRISDKHRIDLQGVGWVHLPTPVLYGRDSEERQAKARPPAHPAAYHGLSHELPPRGSHSLGGPWMWSRLPEGSSVDPISAKRICDLYDEYLAKGWPMDLGLKLTYEFLQSGQRPAEMNGLPTPTKGRSAAAATGRGGAKSVVAAAVSETLAPIKKVTSSTSLASSTQGSTPSAVVSPRKRTPKKVSTPLSLPSPVMEPSARVTDAPVSESVEFIRVSRLLIGDKEYLYHSRKMKVYDMKGRYVGRYDSRKESLCTTVPDSDCDE